MLRALHTARFVNRVRESARLRHRARLRVEELETRCLLSVVYSPAQVRHAYGFDQVTFNNGAVVGDGHNQTIAIVDAYDNPNIFTDLDTFDKQFSINGSQSLYSQYGPASQLLTKAKAQGSASYNSGWATEIALDVEWAHVTAPGAKILLVEARSSSFSNLLGAVDYARKQTGVVAVSMSWGSGEFSGETSYDSYFTTPSGHGGVTFLASSGDNGAPSEWPSASSRVVGVGGTALNLNSDNTWNSETGWSGSGGGVSVYVSKPSYQNSVTQSSTHRTTPDVAYAASTATAVYVYDSGWWAVGGTSVGAPQWAGIVAVADQGRVLASAGTLDGASQTLPALYNLPATAFHDIVSGSNGNPAGTGYDLVTGLGSPVVPQVVAGLVASGRSSPRAAPTTTSTPTTGSTSARPRVTPPVATSTTSLSVDPNAIAAALGSASNRPAAPVVQPSAMPLTGQVVPMAPGSVVLSGVQGGSAGGRVESGGGDGSDLLSDPEPMAPPAERQAPRPRAVPAPMGAPADPTQPDSDNSALGAASWRRACTACFAAESPTLIPVGAVASRTDAPAQEMLPPTEPLAAAAGLAVVLGGYWSASAKEREKDERRRALGV
jgi:hypothetical protein